MIRFLHHHEIDMQAWNRAVRETPDATVCSNSWFLDVVSPGWCALVDGEYDRIFPLTFSRKYGIEYLRQPKFCQQLGVSGVGSLQDPSADIFISECMKRYRFCEINLRTGNTIELINADVTSNRNLVLDLSQNYESILQGYSKNHKRNLNKISDEDLKIDMLTDISEVIGLFQKNRGRELRAYSSKDYGILNQLIISARGNGCDPFIAGVRSDSSDEILCGAIFIEFADRSIFLFSGIGERGREYSAMHYLINEYIKSNAGRLRALDFEGSNNINLARFYSGFAAVESVYLHVRYNNLPVPFRWFK